MIVLIDCGSSKTRYIEDLVDNIIDYKRIALLDFNESFLSDAKGIIISGAPILITEQDIEPYLQRVKWLDSVVVPVLGICFGHQLIGLHFGASGSRMKEDRDWQTIEFFVDNELSNKLPAEVQMIEDHCESISIPPSFSLLASSDVCVNEAMKHETKHIYGVQFHPEVSGNQGAVLIENFINLCLDSFHERSVD